MPDTSTITRVGYVLHRFPYLTETFIARELADHVDSGLQVRIFSLLRPNHSGAPREAARLGNLVDYPRTVPVLRAQWRWLTRAPGRYLRAAAKIVRLTYREPRVLIRALALFPRSTYFAEEVQRLAIQHVHAHFVWLEALTATVIRELTGVPFTIHPHAFGIFGRDQVDVRRQLEQAAGVVAISAYHQEYISALCPTISDERMKVIRCGVDPELFPVPAHRPEPVVVLSVGRAVEKKGHEYLIDACAELARRGSPVECLIVAGTGPLVAPLEERIRALGIESTTRIMGMMPEDELAGLYARSHIFALPAVIAADGDRDGIPMVLMEAMATGMAVISTPVSGIPDLVEHEVTGLLVEPRDHRQLADAIERLAGHPELRTRLAVAGRQRINDHFDVHRNAAELRRFFGAVHTTPLRDAGRRSGDGRGRAQDPAAMGGSG